MNNPLSVIEAWLIGDGQSMAFPVAASLGQAPSNPADAADKLFWWIHRPSNALESRDMALRLRALVDFECFLARHSDHQTWADENILTGVDAGQLPKEFRTRLNNSIAARPRIRSALLAASSAWPAARPDDQSIYAWWRAGRASGSETPEQPPTR